MGVRLAVIITCILLLSLLVTTYRYHDSMLRIQNKALASIGFLLIGIFAWLEQVPTGNWRWGGLILLALIASLVGDVMLGMADYHAISLKNQEFVWGVVWFGVAHGFYSMVFGKIGGWHQSDFWISVVLVVCVWFVSHMSWFDLKGCKWLLYGYSLLLGLMLKKVLDFGMAGIMEVYQYEMIVAAVLFVISDVLLMFKYFYKKPSVWVTLINLTCYYVAQMLFAAGILYL
ncbi:MAG: lysoplasmalogenase family protein [Cellulosilyticaceae bacterium]